MIKSIDWSRINKPYLITVEINSREKVQYEIIKILENQGYKSCFLNHNWIRKGDLWFQLV